MLYNVYLIRHAKTQGNLERKYIGSSDQPLHEIGTSKLKDFIEADYYPEVELVYGSPMQRCKQTAELIYPHLPYKVVPGFTEYNFGEFEGKNYQELKGNLKYRRWIDSGGKDKAPGGEDISSYKRRCCQAFEQVIEEIRRNNIRETALVIHGGTIMAILEKYIPSEKRFYDWQIPNCESYKLVVMDGLWKKEKTIKYYKKLCFPESENTTCSI